MFTSFHHRGLPPSLHHGTGKALARLALRRHLASQLRRAGGPQRVRAALGRGVPYEDAMGMAAKIHKGHAAELAQALGFTISSGVAGARERAVLSRNVSDPLTDLAIMRGTRAVPGGRRQLKVGSRRYVGDAIRKRKYAVAGVDLVANAEALDELVARGFDGAADVADRVRYASSEARQLRSDESEAQAVQGLRQVLSRRTTLSRFEILAASAKSGVDDGVFTFICSLGVALFQGEVNRESWRRIVHDSAVRGAKAAARTSIQTLIVLHKFDHAARAAYSAGLVRKLARTTIAAGAIAEVLVSAAIDFVKLLRREITRQQLLDRVVVNGTTAAGAAAGAYLASRVLSDAPLLVRILGMLFGGAAGGHLGREFGEWLTDRPTTSPTASCVLATR